DALKEPDPQALTYMLLLGAIGPAAEGAMPSIAAKADDKMLAMQAFLVIGRIKPGAFAASSDEMEQRCASGLFHLMHDPESGVNGGMALTLLLMMGDDAAPTFVRCLRDDEVWFRFSIARKIGIHGYSHPSVLAELRRVALEDKEAIVRAEAAIVLA